MRTLIIAFLLVAQTAQAQLLLPPPNQELTDTLVMFYLGERASETYARLKEYWPDSLLEAELPDLPGSLEQKRRYVFAKSNTEAGGNVTAINWGDPDIDYDASHGLLQIVQIRLQDYWNHHPEIEPWFKAIDLSDATKPDSLTKVMPLRILNDAVKWYKLTDYQEIAKEWNIGTNWRIKENDYYGRVKFSYHLMEWFELNGYAAAFNEQLPE